MLQFDPDREVVVPKQAATVVIARAPSDNEPGVEIFCVRRHKASGFLGGAVVFPGGKLDAADQSGSWHELATPVSERVQTWLGTSALTYAVACLRECLEEAAILPVVGDALDDSGAKALRDELAETEGAEEAGGALRTLVEKHGLVLDTGRLEPLAHWITPEAEARRYDTRFFLVEAPPNQPGAHDKHETTESFWARPKALLERWEKNEIFLAPPTSRTIELFANATNLADARAIARRQALTPLCPHLVMADGDTILALPGDPLFPTKEPLPEDETAPTRFVFTNGRLIPHRIA
jgi:8-oxo-dGTP pyrophosphatase MutT (NUDIX family)